MDINQILLMDFLELDDKPVEIHLKYEDIIPYLPPDPPETNDNRCVQEYVQNIREKTHRRYVSRVNVLYDILQTVWPSGTPIDYYIAYEFFATLNEKDFIIKLLDPESIKTITKIVSLRKQGKSSPQFTHQSSTNAVDNANDANQSDSDEDFNSEKSHHNFKKKKKKSHWSENETSKFIKLFTKNNHLKSWKAVSKNFKNKSQEDCYLFYEKLLKNGDITSKYAPKKEPKNKFEFENELDISPYNNIKAIFLEFNDQRSIVGPQSDANKEKARSSPFYGHDDLITNEKMFLPTISEYGTVLDYDTWLKIIQDTQKDPYGMLPIQNKRQITILTKENFPKFEKTVRVVGEKK